VNGSLAVVAAEVGAGEWRAAVVAQRSATPDHTDFYGLACELVATLRALEALTRVLGDQVACYGLGRVLRDDENSDPTVRLVDAAYELARTGALVARAERTANGFWSAIGHIAVEDGEHPR
jgi:hypothetical protein